MSAAPERVATPPPGPLAVTAHVALLFALAVAQPLYDLLGRHAELFVARRTPPGQVLLLVALLSLVVPGLLALAVLGLRRLSPRLGGPALLVLVALLGAVIALPLAKRLPGGAGAALGVAAVVGIVVAGAYRRFLGFRGFLTVFSPAALVFPLVFLFLTPVARVVLPARAGALASGDLGWGEVPVVVVVFDLLPTTALLDAEGGIDAVRYPSFARLAGGSVWFRQGRTVARQTSQAVPALLTGRNPVDKTLPIVEEHPESLFTLLGPRARTWALESMTWLCPSAVCGEAATEPERGRAGELYRDVGIVLLHLLLPSELTRGLPAVDQSWTGFGRGAVAAAAPPVAGLSEEERRARLQEVRKLRQEVIKEDRVAKLERFLAGLPDKPERSLSYLHLNLPHSPLVFLPSGRVYVEPDDPRYVAIGGLLGREPNEAGNRWAAKPVEVELSYRRLLLQIGFADRVLGRILDRLDELGLLDPALLVVVADHGETVVAGGPMRDLADGDTRHVPLFVKVPGQRRGWIDDREADLRDVLPTIAAVLGVEVPWKVDGRVLLDPVRLARASAEVPAELDADRAQVAAWSPPLVAAWKRKLERVGSGDPRPVYAAGPAPELVGRDLGELVAEGALVLGETPKGWSMDLLNGDDLERLRAGATYVPAYLLGDLRLPKKAAPPKAVLFTLDGTVWATAHTFRDGRWLRFGFLVPEEALTRGRHRWKVFVLDEVSGGPRRVTPVPRAGR